ncbi:MAG TPA: thioesterase family protein [Rubrivivax sp.]|nr:thioesterase family protein [Burkholderiales bacterium]HNU10281.1 thioesterase family protein [Rubrivivax sp.]
MKSNTTAVHPLDAALALEPRGEHRWQGLAGPDWANMVGPFGGITAAQLLQACCLHPERQGQALALTVNFAAGVAEGEFEVEARPMRTTRSTQHWTMVLRQQGQVCTTGSAVFATRRQTWSAPELRMPAVPPAEAVAPERRMPPVNWPSRYEFRFVEGGWPDYRDASEQPDSRTVLWVRDEPPRALDAPALAAIADVFYPRIFRRRGRFTPAGTISLTTYFHADEAALAKQGSRPLLAVATGRRFTLGFFDQSAELWSDDGHLLASSHQVVYFKD